MAKLTLHWLAWTWHYKEEEPLPTSFYYDFTNSSKEAILKDWDCDYPDRFTYSTSSGIVRNVDLTDYWRYWLTYKNTLNLSNVTKKITMKLWVMAGTTSWWLYWWTCSISLPWVGSLWAHDNWYNWGIWDTKWKIMDHSWRSPSSWQHWYDIIIRDFENKKAYMQYLWDSTQRSATIQDWQLDVVKTLNTLSITSSTIWWKDILIEWE